MYGPFPENPEEAIRVLLDLEEPDTLRDCHRHCACWDTEGECCGCGEIRTPNHDYWRTNSENDSLAAETSPN